MGYFDDKALYKEIEPVTPQSSRYKSRWFKYGVVTVFVATVCAIIVLVFSTQGGEYGSAIPVELLDNAAVAKLEQSAPTEEDILVELDQGTVRGFRMTSRGGREFLAFRGIPYAKPPVGQLRFQPPEEVGPWDGILNATEFRPECLQRSKGTVKGSEDCLHVNIYTPKKFEELGKRKRLPVMVYIYGGIAGGSSKRNSGEYLMDENVVLVGFNYRVGVLGNLNTNDSEARGNQGLRDQVKALEWIKENIKKFGGDNRKITLFGNSYGSMAIATHLLSPMTKDLFHQVICQSGEAIYPELLQRNPRENAFNLGERLQCNATTSAELLNCFRATDAKTVILTSYDVQPEIRNDISMSRNVFTTSVDPTLEDVNDDEVYLPDTPLQLIQNGETKRMPAIIGVNRGEGLFQSILILESPAVTKAANENWTSMATLTLNLDEPKANDVVAAVRSFYFGSDNISEEQRNNITNLFSDRLFNHPAHVHATYQKRANRRRQDVYLYYFTKEVEGSYLRPEMFNMTDEERAELGPAHADEIQFLFPYEPFPLIPMGSKDANFSQMMVHLWATFAESGKPSGANNNVEWLPIKEKPYDWFQLDVEPKMVNLLGERMDFWDSFELSDLYV